MIECKNLSAGYGKEPVIRNVSLEFQPGELMVVLGPNGCGKSTLLRAALGIIKPMKGEVYYDGTLIQQLSVKEIARRAAFLTQSRDTPDIQAGKMVLHGRFPWLSFPRQYSKKDKEIAENAMETTGCLEYREQLLSCLSGGQRQNVYLAMTIAQTTDTLFMDEPTTYLDINNQLQLLHYAKEAAAHGKAVVMVLHDIPQALQYADRIALFDKGELVCCDTPDMLVSSGQIQKVFSVNLRSAKDGHNTIYWCHRANGEPMGTGNNGTFSVPMALL